MRLFVLFFSLILFGFSVESDAQDHSIAREWNEEILHGIRNDFARPTVHARNLWHSSVAMYDIWAVFDSVATPYFLGNTIGGFEFEFDGFPETDDKDAAINEAISFAIYRLMQNRFENSPGVTSIFSDIDDLMDKYSYDTSFTSEDYSTGNPAALGNYVAARIIEFGLQDNSNQEEDYANLFYEPVNDPLVMQKSGVEEMNDPNRWQPLTLELFIDQSGNEIPGETPDFLSPEWGQVTPFALTQDDLTVYNRDGFDYWVYHDPGPPPNINLNANTPESELYKWGFSMVSVWAAHLDPTDGVMWDISPGASGNREDLPATFEEYEDYYKFIDGNVNTPGHAVNPATGQPYEPNLVPRGDYARVLAEFWADGPDSETPPGHWFTILNYVNDHPQFERKYRGIGERMDALEWDVKSYMMLGGAMHDCAITAWGIKGWYDYLRPVSAIRSMAERGQGSDPTLPNYHPGGIPLVEGYIELIDENDPLFLQDPSRLYQIKILSWRGPDFIQDPEVDDAGVGWIMAKDWWPYQRPSFVTPPFAGYVSGHSTYSRAAAELLTVITGDEFFPGGMGVFEAPQNEFLVFEEGPSVDVVLQWATYRDASDQTSLSRIWGGIHPPADDIPGRLIGIEISDDVVDLAEEYFFRDDDSDGYYNYVDCNDMDPNVNPGMPETCDAIDNNCDGQNNEGLTYYTYYLDSDNDGYGDLAITLDTCIVNDPAGYVSNSMDCNDTDPAINPAMNEICDAIDNNCDGRNNEGLTYYTYYLDMDGDGYGDLAFPMDTCITNSPTGYVDNFEDCNDALFEINPSIDEICDAIDNNCDGRADEGLPKNRYYLDFDGDGFGDPDMYVDTCILVPPTGFVVDFTDCDDTVAGINPAETDIPDNGIDEDCTGYDYFRQSKVFPNPFEDMVRINLEYDREIEIRVYDRMGSLAMSQKILPTNNFFQVDLGSLSEGVHYFIVFDADEEELYADTIVKL